MDFDARADLKKFCITRFKPFTETNAKCCFTLKLFNNSTLTFQSHENITNSELFCNNSHCAGSLGILGSFLD